MIPAAWKIHTITVEAYLGQAGDGSQFYAPAAQVSCFVEERVRHIRSSNNQSSTGDELNSTATAYCELTLAASIPAVSRVTLPSGRQTYVLEALRRDGGALPVPSHLELILQ